MNFLNIDEEKIVEYLAKRLRWYVHEFAKKRNGVVALSGGLDSSVTTCITVRALGKENTFVYLLPSESTPKEDMEDAFELIKMLEIPKENWGIIDITDIVNLIEQKAGKYDKLARGNLMARTRMIIIHHKARIHDGLVIGTGDKSEILLGYFTKYGDAGVDVLPIGGLYKTQVRKIAQYLNVPRRIIEKPPSPRLWPGQTAEGELMLSYDLIDSILYLRFEKWMSDEEISNALKVDLEKVKMVTNRVKETQHKRNLPEVFKLGFRDIGSDWRYPREWI
ncbi:MAG: NAD+ synthase [Thermoproteota archaeon]|jgi:NAD+ synthase